MIAKPVVRIVDCLGILPTLSFWPGEHKPFQGLLSDYINNAFALVNVTLVMSRTESLRTTCKRFGKLSPNGSGYNGMLGLLERNEADTLVVPFPWALDDQIVNFGPMSFREDSTLLHMVNRTYRTPDVTEDFVSMKFNVLGSIFASFTLIATVNYITGLVHAKKRALIDCFWAAFRSFLGANAFDFKSDNRLFRIAVITATMMFVMVFSNLIASNSVTQVETIKFDKLDQLLLSNDFRPIWVANLITANTFLGENSIITKVSRRTFENSSNFRIYEHESKQAFRSMEYVTEKVRTNRRVLVGITTLINFAKNSILESDIQDYEHVHVSTINFDFALFVYGYSKKMETTARALMDKRQYALFESGVSGHMYQDFFRTVCTDFLSLNVGDIKSSDQSGQDGIKQEVHSINLVQLKRIFYFYAVSVIFTAVYLCFELGAKNSKLFNKKKTRNRISKRLHRCNLIVVVTPTVYKRSIKPPVHFNFRSQSTFNAKLKANADSYVGSNSQSMNAIRSFGVPSTTVGH